MKRTFTFWCIGTYSCSALLLLISVNGSTLVLVHGSPAIGSLQIDRPVMGKVIDAKNQALPDVSVVVKDTNKGTTTDATGRFHLRVPD